MIENNPFPEIERRGLLIEIMGLPASGKSTFANFLGERLGVRVLGEIPVERVPNFENYYKRRGDKHLALATQLVFLYESWLQNGGSEPLAIPGVKDILKDGPVFYFLSRISPNKQGFFWRRLSGQFYRHNL